MILKCRLFDDILNVLFQCYRDNGKFSSPLCFGGSDIFIGKFCRILANATNIFCLTINLLICLFGCADMSYCLRCAPVLHGISLAH